MDNAPPSASFHLALGRPLGPYGVFGQVFCRVFSEGLSLINPNDHTVALDLGRTYQTPEGRLITRLTLIPHTEVTLLRT